MVDINNDDASENANQTELSEESDLKPSESANKQGNDALTAE